MYNAIWYVVRCGLCACLLLGCYGLRKPEVASNAMQEVITLSDEQPTASLPISSNLLNNPPSILDVSIERIENESLTPFTLSVFLKWTPKDDGVGARVEVGRFSVFPPNQKGRYTLRASDAFRNISSAVAVDNRLQLVLIFELQPVSQTRPLKNVKVHLGSVNWRYSVNN